MRTLEESYLILINSNITLPCSCNINHFFDIKNILTSQINFTSEHFREYLNYMRGHIISNKKIWFLTCDYKIPYQNKYFLNFFDAYFKSIETVIFYFENKYGADVLDEVIRPTYHLIYDKSLEISVETTPMEWRKSWDELPINDFLNKKILTNNISVNMLEVYTQSIKICNFISVLET